MSCGGTATFNTLLQDCICPDFSYVIEDFVNAEKTCSATCANDAWPGPSNTYVSECVKCPNEGQIYNQNTDNNVSECVCDADEYKTTAGICISNEDALEFTRDNSEFSPEVA